VRIITKTPGVVLELREGSLPTDPSPLPKGPYASNDDPVWRSVCPAPCDTAVQLGGEYRIAGEGVTRSSPFALRGPSTELHVDAGSYSVRRAGGYLAVIGFVGALAGGIFLAVEAVRPSDTTHGLGTDGYAALGGAIAGGVVGLVGVGMIVGAGTSVRDETRRDLALGEPGHPPFVPRALHATFRF
jgi:hypothetical protein